MGKNFLNSSVAFDILTTSSTDVKIIRLASDSNWRFDYQILRMIRLLRLSFHESLIVFS